MTRLQKNLRDMTLAALFLAIGMVLPFLTGQIPAVGKMLLPMHIPVLLCGLICGWKHGFSVGLILPVLRGAVFGMPVLYPTGVGMAVELAVYGGAVGMLYAKSKWHCTCTLYRSLLLAMLLGRLAWGAAQTILLGFGGSGFTFGMFLAGALTNAIPGILVQLTLIPMVMVALGRAKLVPFGKPAVEKRQVEI